MTILTVRWVAPENMRLARDAFASSVGQTLAVVIDDRRLTGQLIRADVPPGGAYVDFTIDVPAEVVDVRGDVRPSSIAFYDNDESPQEGS